MIIVIALQAGLANRKLLTKRTTTWHYITLGGMQGQIPSNRFDAYTCRPGCLGRFNR